MVGVLSQKMSPKPKPAKLVGAATCLPVGPFSLLTHVGWPRAFATARYAEHAAELQGLAGCNAFGHRLSPAPRNACPTTDRVLRTWRRWICRTARPTSSANVFTMASFGFPLRQCAPQPTTDEGHAEAKLFHARGGPQGVACLQGIHFSATWWPECPEPSSASCALVTCKHAARVASQRPVIPLAQHSRNFEASAHVMQRSAHPGATILVAWRAARYRHARHDAARA